MHFFSFLRDNKSVQSLTQSPDSPDPIPSIATQPHFGRARSPLTAASNSHTSRTSPRLLSAASFLGESCVCPNNPVFWGVVGCGWGKSVYTNAMRRTHGNWRLQVLDSRLRPSLRSEFVFKLLDHLPPPFHPLAPPDPIPFLPCSPT